ncbi:MAG: hypothetical protein EPN92_01655 [Chitinophagaceae bacterium]|nr:MAG: hypothetical protein EPN92_01655 [Chitinophagaceae bacterium]
MKKVFAIMAVATLMVACNNSSENKEAKTDTTAKTEAAAADSTQKAADSTQAAAVDTTKK